MKNTVFTAMFFTSLLTALPAVAGVAGATADGTWDCQAMDGAAVGSVVVAGATYAFMMPDGKLGSYGKLYRVGEEQFDLPVFVVVDGYLKDEIGAEGLAMKGPRGREHDLSGELFLELSITETDLPYCRRRVIPAS